MTLNAEKRARLNRVAQAIAAQKPDGEASLQSLDPIFGTDKSSIIYYLQERVATISNGTKGVLEADKYLFDSSLTSNAIYLVVVLHDWSGNDIVTELTGDMILIGLEPSAHGYHFGMKRASQERVENRRLYKDSAGQPEDADSSITVQIPHEQPLIDQQVDFTDPALTVEFLNQHQLATLYNVAQAIALRQRNDTVQLQDLKEAFDNETGRGAIFNYLSTWVKRLSGGGTFLFKADPDIFAREYEGSAMFLAASDFEHQPNVDESGALNYASADSILIVLEPIIRGYDIDVRRASLDLVTARRDKLELNTPWAKILPPGKIIQPPLTTLPLPVDNSAELQAKQAALAWLYEAVKAHVALREDSQLATIGLEIVVGDVVTFDKLLEACKLLGTTLDEIVANFVLKEYQPSPLGPKPVFGEAMLNYRRVMSHGHPLI